MRDLNIDIQGLSEDEVSRSRARYGINEFEQKKKHFLIKAIGDLLSEPMILLLLTAAILYFISGEVGDGIFMAAAIILVASISLYQDSRSRNALEALKDLTQPLSRVIRDGDVKEIPIKDIVVGDCIIVEEGSSIPADGKIIQSNDFSVNESILTGESSAVIKSDGGDNKVFMGTTVSGGLAICNVTEVGNATRLGLIGKSIESIKEERTPLQLQIGNFMKRMVIAGAVIFFLVWILNFFDSKNILDSLLKALTLAMSILPEEIPVAFTTFMALGAWRLMKMGIIVKQTKTVESLGSANIICLDKTGTITENRMELSSIFVLGENILPVEDINNVTNDKEKELLATAMWASEPIPFDTMEIAIHNAYEKLFPIDERKDYSMVHEYPLDGRPPMMTHVFGNQEGNIIIAAKGAPEALINLSTLTDTEKKIVNEAVVDLSDKGYRVLGVGQAIFSGDHFPRTQQEFKFNFKGLLAFLDPPKKNIPEVLDSFYNAGIDVKIATGDNTETTLAIARMIKLRGIDDYTNGEKVMSMDDSSLKETALRNNIFTRMFPEAKLKLINALKASGKITAMTGDGVNDGPALRAANIGVSMGSKGSEIAKQASSLILVDNDLAKMVDAIAMGRKIYTNLKKAIQYIISIHIPIILTVFLPLALAWKYPNIFSPVHIIFFELIMGPTCSIIYENEPIEKNVMNHKPRPFTKTFFTPMELGTSIVQGLFITIGILFTYQYSVMLGLDEPSTRTMVFIAIISANIFLTLVNRSFYYSIFTTLRYRNKLVPMIILVTIAICVSLLVINPVTTFFEFSLPPLPQLGIAVVIGFISVIWFEAVKFIKRRVEPNG
ncbi:MAG: cation-translocating P-type ATPase [Ignavibacteriae bacterium]|nr:cation-translocating P-type ATPase [Ignavibacteriota bacterium]MCB9242718.1 cation-translocating P-type ATPase [Ignavibacteriales bacterium]